MKLWRDNFEFSAAAAAAATCDASSCTENVEDRSRRRGPLCSGVASEEDSLGSVNGGIVLSSSAPGLVVDSTGCWVASGLDVLSVNDGGDINDGDDSGMDDEKDDDCLCLHSCGPRCMGFIFLRYVVIYVDDN